MERRLNIVPFLVREEKILIMAMESEDMKQITRCLLFKFLMIVLLQRMLKSESLATFDIEYLFLNVRARSVGETVSKLTLS